MEIRYKVQYLKGIISKQIDTLPSSVKILIQRAIEERLMVDPISFGKPLRYNLKGHRRLRIGDYRIVYRIDSKNKMVLIVAIKHRKDIYAN
jgi:mRNA interferase RelE/StbE